MPLSFEPNRGQASTGTLFLAHAGRYAVLLCRNAVELGGVRVTYGNARPDVQVYGHGRLPGVVNYLLGASSTHWQVDIPTYRAVTYHNLYRGIDLTYGGQAGQLHATWTIAPGARSNQIRLLVAGTHRLPQKSHGALVALGATVGAAPAYQVVAGKRRHIFVRFQLGRGGRLSMQTGAYDRRQPLVIGPTLAYSTNLGGSSSDFASGIAVDGAGNSYVAGSTSSPDFPVAQAVQPRAPGTTDQEDAFVAKLNPTGSALLFSTYLGGNNDEDGAGIALGPANAIYVTGFTRSTNFPQRHTTQQQKSGCNSDGSNTGDAFVVKLAPRGDALIYSTCLGGSATDWGTSIAVDGSGASFVTGSTGSSNFPTLNPLQRHRAGGVDAFVAKLSAGGRLVFSTYLGGNGADQGTGIALDAAGSTYVVGSTTSTHFPMRSALQPRLAGTIDAFVVKLSPAGRRLIYGTYLGGSGVDTALGVTVDLQGDAYVTGTTESRDFPTIRAFQVQSGGGTDAFVTELSPGGTAVVFSTYLGGSGNEIGTAIAVDSGGHTYVTGSTASTAFPLQHPLQAAYAGGYFYGDAFLAEFSAGGQSLLYGTYLGGKGDDVGTAIALGRSGDVYLTGGTSSADYPVTHDLGGSRPARGNAFVLRIRISGMPAAPSAPLQTTDQTGPSSIRARHCQTRVCRSTVAS